MPTFQPPLREAEPTTDDTPSGGTADAPLRAPFPYGDGDRGEPIAVATTSRVLVAGDRRAEPPTCPSCAAETVNGAGLFACVDCDWTGPLR